MIKEDKQVSFKTLNQSTANKVNIGMMVFMVGGMIVFSVVDNKKKQVDKIIEKIKKLNHILNSISF